MKLTTLLIFFIPLMVYSKVHWPAQIIIVVPDSLKSPDFEGEIQLGATVVKFDQNGLDTNVIVHFKCDSATHVGAAGYYLAQETEFMLGLSCSADTIRGILDFLVPAPRALGPPDTTVYAFKNSVLKGSGSSVPGHPITGYIWEKDLSNYLMEYDYVPNDSSSVTVLPLRAGTFLMRFMVKTSQGVSFPDTVLITAIEQPDVNNQVNWNVTFDGSPTPCTDFHLILNDDPVFNVGRKIDISCSALNTVYNGRMEGLKEILLGAPGYYQIKDTLCNLCTCQDFGFSQDPAQILNCSANFVSGPTAHAGEDFTVALGNLGFLDASKSQAVSPQYPIEMYTWICDPNKSTATCLILNPRHTKDSLPFVPRDTGTLVMQLEVKDSVGASRRDEVVINVVSSLPTAERIKASYKIKIRENRLSLNFSQPVQGFSLRDIQGKEYYHSSELKSKFDINLDRIYSGLFFMEWKIKSIRHRRKIFLP